jgi:hypothetical protein
MLDLMVRIKKKTNGEAALSCIRADGSTTWQRQEGQLGRIFPLHDLTHFAVETTLGFDSAFYGLLASGWDISDFGGPGARLRVPAEAMLSELIVGRFDLERMMNQPGSADDLNALIVEQVADDRLPPTTFRITETQMTAIRRRRGELFALWNALPPGDALELPFERLSRHRTSDTKSATGA